MDEQTDDLRWHKPRLCIEMHVQKPNYKLHRWPTRSGNGSSTP